MFEKPATRLHCVTAEALRGTSWIFFAATSPGAQDGTVNLWFEAPGHERIGFRVGLKDLLTTTREAEL